MKFFKFLFAVLVLSGIFSCKKTKYETTTVKALVFDENTQQYIPNVKTLLYEVQQVTSVFGGHPTIKGGVIKEINTDANGQADFGEFEAKKSISIFVISNHHK